MTLGIVLGIARSHGAGTAFVLRLDYRIGLHPINHGIH
jgi:hypothetical protein